MNENLNNKLVLIVDDDDFFTNLLKNKLIGLHYLVEVLNDGEKVLDFLNNNHPTAILLDIALPHVSGFEILGKIKLNPNWKDIPVYIISGLSQETDIKIAKDLGVAGYFVKSKNDAHKLLEEVSSSINSLP